MVAIATAYIRRGPSFLSALWVTGIFLRILATAMVVAIPSLMAVIFPVLALVVATDMGCFIWSMLRYHTAAGQHIRETMRVWSVIFGYIFYVLASFAMFVSWWYLFSFAEIREMPDEPVRELTPPPPNHERYVIEMSRDRTQLVFKGVIAPGAADAIAAEMERSGKIERLILHSAGGNLYEARRMSQEVMSRGIETFVANECGASCTMVFMAGEKRTLGPGAMLGFHRYGLDFLQVLPHLNPLREMRIDQQYYLERDVDLEFLDVVFNLERSAIWYPSRAQLVRARILN